MRYLDMAMAGRSLLKYIQVYLLEDSWELMNDKWEKANTLDTYIRWKGGFSAYGYCPVCTYFSPAIFSHLLAFVNINDSV